MTIEALLTDLNSKFDVLISLLGNQDGGTAAAPAAAGAASTPAKRGRGRPAADDPKPAPAAAPAAAPVVASAPEVDPFDEPAPVVTPAKKADKADVRSALEAFRLRLKNANLAVGDTEADAQTKATTRALAWLKEVSGTSTLALLEESKFALVVEKAQTAK